MEYLQEKFRQKIAQTSVDFVRSLIDDIHWKARLIGIKGQRGVGKTTLMLQYIKLNLSDKLDETLYISLDNLWFSNNPLPELIDEFVKKGGNYLFIDEVHKYPNCAQILKNTYDDYPKLKIVFTGSSLLEILNARADLSRRAVVYTMQGFSFREYLEMETGHKFERLTLEHILKNHEKEAVKINEKIRPFQYFGPYLKHGYYPFHREDPELFTMRLEEVINMMLEIELPQLRQIDIAYIHKIKQLLVIIAESVPFIPNVSKISDKIGLNRGTLLGYFHYLQEVGLTHNLFKETTGISLLQKPAKLYLDNPNLIFVLSNSNHNIGNLRETFFANQMRYKHALTTHPTADFVADNKYTFEIGGTKKRKTQIADLKDAYLVADNIEYGSHNKIPIWMFGFLY